MNALKLIVQGTGGMLVALVIVVVVVALVVLAVSATMKAVESTRMFKLRAWLGLRALGLTVARARPRTREAVMIPDGDSTLVVRAEEIAAIHVAQGNYVTIFLRQGASFQITDRQVNGHWLSESIVESMRRETTRRSKK